MTDFQKKYGVIDVGSNSVRLMMAENGKTLYKSIKVTKLAEGLSKSGVLIDDAVERTARAVSFFVDKAKCDGAENVFVFATAAARKASNGYVLKNRIKELTGIDTEIISGDTEAELGALGAIYGKDGGVIDIGGASSEIIVKKNGQTIYSFSLDVGSVRIFDLFGQDKIKAENYLKEKVSLYGDIPKCNFFAIGGTATSIAAIIQELSLYDPEKVDGFIISSERVKELKDKLYSMTVDERKKLKGLQPERAEVIAGGTAILSAIMEKANIKGLTVRESDNLEGYVVMKRRNYD